MHQVLFIILNMFAHIIQQDYEVQTVAPIFHTWKRA